MLTLYGDSPGEDEPLHAPTILPSSSLMIRSPRWKYRSSWVMITTPFIRESVSEVFHTLQDAVILVAIVVLIFLQDWRATLIPMLAVVYTS